MPLSLALTNVTHPPRQKLVQRILVIETRYSSVSFLKDIDDLAEKILEGIEEKRKGRQY